MATQYKTPGVYIKEPDSFPPSIVGVDTAVPAFIGYTERATDTDRRDLHMIPKRITSMAEFVSMFGGGFPEQYYLTTGTIPPADRDWGLISLDGATSYHLVEVGKSTFNLYNSLRLFYANGGGACYIVSCGTYQTDGSTNKMAAQDFTDGLAVCGAISGPTMLAIPDAVLLDTQAHYNGVAVAMLQQCQEKGDRMALLDVYGADTLTARDDFSDVIDAFRVGLAGAEPESLRYGAAYFPSLVTSIVQPSDLDMGSFQLTGANKTTLITALTAVLAVNYPGTPPAAPANTDKPDPNAKPPKPSLSAKGQKIIDSYVSKIGSSVSNDTPSTDAVPRPLTDKALSQALIANVPGFSQLLNAMAATQSILPPSGAMAGIWTANDNIRGVWNAPANVGIAGLIAPNLPVSDDQQEDLNVPVMGLAVNAVRSFAGRGSLIWGARTLDSLSNDWRYVQVRRTMIYVEQSVKDALQRSVFKPNTAQTWVTVTSMIESFLHGLWAAGGLMGASPGEAFSVIAGLGSTMTPDDVLNGVMRVQITLQMVHPAEFIELTFKQQMLGGA